MPARASTRRQDAVTGFFTAAVCVLLGAPAGIVWSALAPHARIDITAAGASFSESVTEVFVAADGWFLAVSLVAGLITGTIAWFVARRSGPYTVVALAVGGLLAAYVASKVGMRLGQDELREAAAAGIEGRYVANVAVQATQVLLVWPIAALAAFVTLVVSKVDEIR